MLRESGVPISRAFAIYHGMLILGRPVEPGDDVCECCKRGALHSFRLKKPQPAVRLNDDERWRIALLLIRPTG
jgi:hypothetical protein